VSEDGEYTILKRKYIDRGCRIAELEAENKAYKEAWSVNILTKRIVELESKVKQLQTVTPESCSVLEAENQRLKAVVQKMRPLVQEIIDMHADPDCAEYNCCDTDPCMWCEQMEAALEQTNEQ